MALDKVVRVEVSEVEPMPARRRQVLKDLIRRAALRRLHRIVKSEREAAQTRLGRFFEPHQNVTT